MTTFIAIDSGGTRTSIAVQRDGEDEPSYTRQLDVVLDGTLAPYLYTKAIREIISVLEPFWAEHDLADRPASIFFSAAGFSAPTRLDFHSSLGEALPDALGGSIKSAGAANDAVALILGYQADGVIIAGTGSNVVVRSPGGDVHQSGGDDWVAGDFGSGFWIGLRAIRQASRDLEAGIDSDVLSAFREVYGVNRRHAYEQNMAEKFQELAIADVGMKAEIARIAARICQAASDRVVEAQDIVKSEAEELADSAATALRRRLEPEQFSRGLTLVQSGSLLSHDFYRNAFENQLNLRLGSLSPQDAPVTWINTRTGIDASLMLAQQLVSDPQALAMPAGFSLGLSPVVAHYS